MFKRILVAVDASETGELALQTAIGLAAESQARLRIVNVVDTANINPHAGFPGQSKAAEGSVKTGQEILDRAEAAAAAAGLAAETSLVRIETLDQRISEAIAHDAEAWPADLVVIGTHGRRGLSRLFLGSVAEGVARLATTPVLLVRGS
jgi:nucleotide-binding universal stress UspA family protein